MTVDNGNSAKGGERKATSVSSRVHWTDFRLMVVILVVCAVLYAVTATFEEVAVTVGDSVAGYKVWDKHIKAEYKTATAALKALGLLKKKK